MKYRQAHLSDVTDIQSLLDGYGLPASDIQNHISNFVVTEMDNTIIGVGGFESCESLGLLRSFAVSPGEKGNGIAGHIFGLVKTKAIDSGICRFYLLTTTASKYFERFGFSVCNRDDVPNSIKATKQFSELCPCTAVVMVLDLDT